MIGTFQEWGRTSKGGPKLKLDGRWVYPSRGCNTDGLNPGMAVEYETSMGGNDGKLVILNRIRPAPQGSAPPANNAAPYDESELRFISNVVGSALTAGTIKEPGQLMEWALAAQGALKALKGPKDPLDDDLPDSFESEDPAPKGGGAPW